MGVSASQPHVYKADIAFGIQNCTVHGQTGSNAEMENKQIILEAIKQHSTNSNYCKIFTAPEHIKNESVVPTKILQAINCSITITTNRASLE